jgi:hypothetical protein
LAFRGVYEGEGGLREVGVPLAIAANERGSGRTAQDLGGLDPRSPKLAQPFGGPLHLVASTFWLLLFAHRHLPGYAPREEYEERVRKVIVPGGLYSPSCREDAFSEIRQDKRGNLPNGYAPQVNKSEPMPPPTGPAGELVQAYPQHVQRCKHVYSAVNRCCTWRMTRVWIRECRLKRPPAY